MADSRPFCFISAKIVTGYRCVIPQPTFSFISMIQFFCIVFELRKCLRITQIQNGRVNQVIH